MFPRSRVHDALRTHARAVGLILQIVPNRDVLNSRPSDGKFSAWQQAVDATFVESEQIDYSNCSIQ